MFLGKNQHQEEQANPKKEQQQKQEKILKHELKNLKHERRTSG